MVAALALSTIGCSHTEDIGSVSTSSRITGSDKIAIETFGDLLVQGMTHYALRAYTGGAKGLLGVAEDVSEAAVACRQIGRTNFVKPLSQQDDMSIRCLSLVPKMLHMVCTVDRRRSMLIYLTCSDEVILGSLKNSMTTVPIPASQLILVK